VSRPGTTSVPGIQLGIQLVSPSESLRNSGAASRVPLPSDSV